MKRELMNRETIIKANKLVAIIKSIAMEDLKIPNIEICICDIGRSYGCFSPKDKKVYISNTISDINVFIDCIFHELRHVYQIINNREILKNYNKATCKEEYDSYYNHPAEIDAREYAINVMERYESKIKEIKYLYRRNML